MTRKYETIFIINPELSEEETKALVEKIKGTIEASAQLESIDEWAKGSLLTLSIILMRVLCFGEFHCRFQFSTRARKNFQNNRRYN